MKYIFIIAVAICFSLPFLNSCSYFNQSVAVNDTIPYKTLVFEKIDNNCKEKDCTSFSSEYIEFKDNPYRALTDSVNKYIRILFFGVDSLKKTFNSSPNAFADSFLKQYAEFKKADTEYSITWFINSKQNVTYNKNGVFSFSVFTDDFLGGAHGSASETLFNFDVKSGKQITLNDIIINNDNGELMRLGEKYFRIAQGLNDQINLEDAGYFTITVDEKDEGIFKLTDNFAFTPQGLYFSYAQYQIGPYAIGMPSFTIPYSQLKNIAQKNSLLENIIKQQAQK